MNQSPKPKVEPTSDLIIDLYDQLGHAIDLIDCAYFATHHNTVPDEIGDPLRATLDDGVKGLKLIKTAMHDMVVWET